MRILVRALTGAMAGVAIVSLVVSAALAATSTGSAGRYHVVFVLTCRDTPQNARACAIADNAKYAVFGKVGTFFTDYSVVDAVVDGKGTFTFRLSDVATERGTPHAGRYCDINSNTVAFNGICRTTQTGKGFVAKGVTGMNDFFATESMFTLHGRTTKTLHLTAKKGIDTQTPAAAGHWNTARYLALLGIKHVPAGITVDLLVARR